jgi:hypothetical protein
MRRAIVRIGKQVHIDRTTKHDRLERIFDLANNYVIGFRNDHNNATWSDLPAHLKQGVNRALTNECSGMVTALLNRRLPAFSHITSDELLIPMSDSLVEVLDFTKEINSLQFNFIYVSEELLLLDSTADKWFLTPFANAPALTSEDGIIPIQIHFSDGYRLIKYRDL